MLNMSSTSEERKTFALHVSNETTSWTDQIKLIVDLLQTTPHPSAGVTGNMTRSFKPKHLCKV